jgi:hypothetical protein
MAAINDGVVTDDTDCDYNDDNDDGADDHDHDHDGVDAVVVRG